MTVMDKVKGWNEEQWVGSKFAASMSIHTKAVMCDGRGRPPQDLRQMLRIIMECVRWATEDCLWEHEWVTEPNVLWKENDMLEALDFDIDVLCPLQWEYCGSPHRQASIVRSRTMERTLKKSWKLSTRRLRSHLTCPLTEFTRHERAYCAL